jgi:hypothetical protein
MGEPLHQSNSIQFKALFRVDINHTYNTSSNELLKSTMVSKSIINTTVVDVGFHSSPRAR